MFFVIVIYVFIFRHVPTTPGISRLKLSTISCFFLRRASSCLSTRASPSWEATSSSACCRAAARPRQDPTSACNAQPTSINAALLVSPHPLQ